MTTAHPPRSWTIRMIMHDRPQSQRCVILRGVIQQPPRRIWSTMATRSVRGSGIVPLLIYPGRIPKFHRDLKRAVPKTHLKVPTTHESGTRLVRHLNRSPHPSEGRQRSGRRGPGTRRPAGPLRTGLTDLPHFSRVVSLIWQRTGRHTDGRVIFTAQGGPANKGDVRTVGLEPNGSALRSHGVCDVSVLPARPAR